MAAATGKKKTGQVIPISDALAASSLERPRPPEHLTTMQAMLGEPLFVPAPELTAWIGRAYLQEDGPLYFEDHLHLCQARIGALWTNAANERQGRRIVGQAELPANALPKGKWARARGEQQLREWFGDPPDFLLTFDALYATDCDDATFAALVDHELCHCAQAVDQYGMPRFNKETGEPIWGMRGHDVEEFVSVVRRFGIEAAGPAATDMVIAAAQKPEISPVELAQACGTCAARAA
ncbi:putative metallopeptidase [Fodinicurvata sediminis]|uniref:putative metallopeptidase n=1 Tax=Fodinicurvata sediminis TaxID=1121832 RepID=UPI0003B72A1B|nr:putative metallopeptidase [Fodinicurvata sediminis]